MSPAYKKIALAVCLGGGLIGLGYYMGQGSAPVTAAQPAAAQVETSASPAEAPKAEVLQASVAPTANQSATGLPLHSMRGLTAKTVADIEIFKSDTPSIEIVGESQELIDTIKTEMVGPNLIVSHVLTKSIKAKCGSSSVSLDLNGSSTKMNINSGGKQGKNHCALVRIGVKEVPAIQLESSGNVDLSGVDQKQLLLKVAGSGNITGAGKVEDLLLWVSGSGEIDTADIKAQQLRVLSEGSGNVNAAVEESLVSALQGSGNITIIGNPHTKRHEETGSGKFRLFGSVTK
jgi:hypothetical protein